MSNIAETSDWHPVIQMERCHALDALRGLALLGVLLVNLLGDFRVSLAEHILTFHTHPRWANRVVDVLVAGIVEFKAFAVFSLLFGVGVAVFADRAAARHAGATRFLARRFAILLAMGLCHLLAIWNGDILTLYAVCGFLLLPILRLPVAALAGAGVASVVLTFIIPWEVLLPSNETLRDLAADAARVYSKGGFGDVLVFHWRETRLLVMPLLVASLPRTWGLMALGAAAWRAGVFCEPGKHRGLLWAIALAGGVIGGSGTALAVYSASTGRPPVLSPLLIEAGSSVPLALAYVAGLMLAMRTPRVAAFAAPFAAAGQMALTNYLTQSVILSLLFYAYGLGLYGHFGSAAASMIGVSLFLCQLGFSWTWLQRYQFGPIEWFWRSLTYGRRQPMRRIGTPAGRGLV